MISRALVIRYTGEVTVKYSARCFRVALPLNAAIVPGTMMSDWAKMMGITFAVLSRSGMNVFRSEEHTSELQSRFDLVCRLLLEKKKNNSKHDQCRRQSARVLGRRMTTSWWVDHPTATGKQRCCDHYYVHDT